ncbi:DUF1801 domain-containing protein [Actinomycetaceae bacterium L2_0104]
MAKTHPHIDSPTALQLRSLLEGRPGLLVQVYLALHELVVTALPDVRFSVDTVDAAVGYGARQYGYNGWGMAALTPFGKWVSLTLLQGSKLEDPERLLKGTAVMRHIRLSKPVSVQENRAEISRLVVAASRLYDKK